MADIIWKDATGKPIVYKDVNQIEVPSTDGGVVIYTEGSGGGGVIEVNEFPTENVQEEFIYKKIITESPRLYLQYESQFSDLSSDPKNHIYRVKKLPDDMLITDLLQPESSIDWYIYILDDGIPYVKVINWKTGVGLIIVDLGYLYREVFGLNVENKGFIESVDEIISNGFYVIDEKTFSKLGVKGETLNYIENEWINFPEIIEKNNIKHEQEINDLHEYYNSLNEKVINLEKSFINLISDDDVKAPGGEIYFENDEIRQIRRYAFYNFSDLRTINCPNVTDVGEYAFSGCSGLYDIKLPKIEKIYKRTFSQNLNFFNNGLEFPLVKYVYEEAFYQCILLESISFPKAVQFFSGAFMRCFRLKALILQYNNVVTLNDTSIFTDCFHILGETSSNHNPEGLKDGYIYVLDTLVDSYKNSTNWSEYASQIKPLSELPEKYKNLYNIEV